MKNTMYILLTAVVLVAVPACCGSKKKNQTKKEEITLNNAIDTVSIESVQEVDESASVNSKF